MFRVLVVDDEYGLRLLVSTALHSAGYHTQEAESGLEALEILQRDPHFDVIISDIRMSKMSGIQFLEEVTRLYPAIPVILSSVHTRSDIVAQVMDAGAAYFLPRPFKINQLQEAIYDVLHRHSNV